MGNNSVDRPKGFGDITSQSAIAYVQNSLNKWVEDTLRQWKPPSRVSHGTVIREPVHGSLNLDPHEVAILDMPIVQRLRQIRQAGLANYIYPGMLHSRFEHSLGVLNIAQSMLDILRQKEPVDAVSRAEIRLAALLHDIGMLPFGYLTEPLIKIQLPELTKIHEETYLDEPRFFEGNTLSEVFSYLIITCPAFMNALNKYIIPMASASGFDLLCHINLEIVGRLIIGKTKRGLDPWLVDIINGPFDADQVDYIVRDSYYSGIKLGVDIERMLQGLRVVHAPKWEGVLSLNSDSVIYLQSFLLSKLNLYFQIYYHHKLRALECMFRGALEQAMETGGHLPSTIENWFDISENDLISVAPSLMKRNVIKRCLVLDRTTVEQESHRSLNRLASDVENRHTLRRLREEIYENLPAHARTSFAELWIDSPTLPYISRQMLMCPIWMAGEVIALNDLFPLDSLFHAYVADKARIYVFYSDNPVGRQLVADIAERIFREEYGICLKPLAKALALQDMSDDT